MGRKIKKCANMYLYVSSKEIKNCRCCAVHDPPANGGQQPPCVSEHGLQPAGVFFFTVGEGAPEGRANGSFSIARLMIATPV